MNILEKLLGRMKMAMNTMEKHQDTQVRHDNVIRAQCYQNAFDDVAKDEELKAAYDLALRIHTLWQMDRLQYLSSADYITLRPMLVEFDEKRRKE